MFEIQIHPQPDDESCGPTCLHAVYNYYGHEITLEELARTVERSLSGGTLSPLLGTHAQMAGFDTAIYINNMNVFDPTWFKHGKANPLTLYKKLEEQIKQKQNPGIQQVSKAYLRYLSEGGLVLFKSLEIPVLTHYFNQKVPIIAGLNATYLYRTPRELYENGVCIFDDINGEPCGHFVVLCGYDESIKHVVVADPHRENPLSQNNYYKVSSHRLLNSIMLGISSYDANLLIIRPKSHSIF